MQDELLAQLHKQYAINNNAGLSSIVTLLVAMFGVLGVYAYIFVHTSLDFSNDFSLLYDKSTELYSLDVLILATTATFVVLGIIIYICIHQGYQPRFEQFIIHQIRLRYFDDEDMQNIFPTNYTPFGKGKFEAIQGLYGNFINIAKIVSVLLGTATFLKILCSILIYHQNGLSYYGIIEIIICIVILIIEIIYICYDWQKLFDKYKRKQRYFATQNAIRININQNKREKCRILKCIIVYIRGVCRKSFKE